SHSALTHLPLTSFPTRRSSDLGSFHSGEFFHGPFEIVDKDVPFILLMNDGKTRSVDARALTFLNRFDALTTVVDAKDYGLGGVVPSNVATLFDPKIGRASARDRVVA